MNDTLAQLAGLTCEHCGGELRQVAEAERLFVCANWHMRLVTLRELDDAEKRDRQRAKLAANAPGPNVGPEWREVTW